ncbi:MAG: hypothetical protein ACRC6L_12935 [Steroidobacteraceae bacterium]
MARSAERNGRGAGAGEAPLIIGIIFATTRSGAGVDSLTISGYIHPTPTGNATMETTLTNTADTTLVILIFDDGERITRELAITRGDFSKSIEAFGQEFAQTREHMAKLVVISGTNVCTYNRREIPEILGIEG